MVSRTIWSPIVTLFTCKNKLSSSVCFFFFRIWKPSQSLFLFVQKVGEISDLSRIRELNRSTDRLLHPFSHWVLREDIVVSVSSFQSSFCSRLPFRCDCGNGRQVSLKLRVWFRLTEPGYTSVITNQGTFSFGSLSVVTTRTNLDGRRSTSLTNRL